MIARHEANKDRMDIWAKLSAPLPADVISWRQDGKPVQRDGKYVARFVAYIEANTVRERLDSVTPGEWDLTLELLPTIAGQDEDGEQTCSFKARLQILGVIREDVGTGRDYKSAATDAFKRAGVRFGIAHELYSYEQNWVTVDGDGRYAKPLEDPGTVYARRAARAAARVSQVRGGNNGVGAHVQLDRANAEQSSSGGPVLDMGGRDERPVRRGTAEQASEGVRASADVRGDVGDTPAAHRSGASVRPDAVHQADAPVRGDAAGESGGHVGQGPGANSDEVACPKCGGRTWDNRLSKRNPKAPDYKCRNRSCDGVVWPAKKGQPVSTPDDDEDYGF